MSSILKVWIYMSPAVTHQNGPFWICIAVSLRKVIPLSMYPSLFVKAYIESVCINKRVINYFCKVLLGHIMPWPNMSLTINLKIINFHFPKLQSCVKSLRFAFKNVTVLNVCFINVAYLFMNFISAINWPITM